MFRWLTGRSDESDRLVFRFKDGNRKRFADPIVVERSLIESLGREWRQTLLDLAKPAPAGLVGEQREEAESKAEALRSQVLRAALKAFDVQPLHEERGRMVGLTEVETFDLLGGFLRFCNDLLRLARPFVSARSRASPIPERPPSASGSGSTSAETTSPQPAMTS